MQKNTCTGCGGPSRRRAPAKVQMVQWLIRPWALPVNSDSVTTPAQNIMFHGTLGIWGTKSFFFRDLGGLVPLAPMQNHHCQGDDCSTDVWLADDWSSGHLVKRTVRQWMVGQADSSSTDG